MICASAVMAQAPSVRGIVFDSLRNAPLAGAFVTIAGNGISRSATSDSLGHFHFDSLRAGSYTLAAQHDVLDSIGVGSITTRATVGNAASEVAIAVPSFAALWGRWCQSIPPKDTGLVHGTVRDLAGRAVPRATVEVSWTDYNVDGKSLRQRGKLGRVVADADGNFALCGIPANTAFTVHAALDSASSGSIDLLLANYRITRRDLRVTTPSEGVGIVAGLVTQSGKPFPGARVIVAGRPEQRTGNDGKFIVRDVPAGTRQVDILSVGMTPGTIAVDVPVRDTVVVTFDMQKVVSLPGVKVEGLSMRKRIFADIDDRRRSGFGHFVDSTEIRKYGDLSPAFGSMPFARVQLSGAHIGKVLALTHAGSWCEAAYLVDGHLADASELADLNPGNVVAIEFYRGMVPHDIIAKVEAAGDRSQRRSGCAVVAFWTRRYAP
jgi:hypothetical protein